MTDPTTTKDDRRSALKGRVLWALNELEKAGSKGITTMQYPGVRVSDAIMKLRRSGFSIETVREPHQGQFPGHHGRYVLHQGEKGAQQ